MNTSFLHSIAPQSRRIAACTGLSRQVRGFTLVELLIVMAVAAVLMGSAAPSLTNFVKSIQLSSASNDLLAGLLMARSEAAKRNGRAAICKSANGLTCAPSGGWQQGWIVFHDANSNGVRDTGEAIIQRQEPLSADMRVTGNLNVARYVSYAPSGLTKLAGGGFQAGTLTLCRHSLDGGEARQIILSSSGRPRVQKTHVDSCA
ncbi:MAG: GspH/FimT family pseudopilin [Ramlibacter sp.]|nr:GspH/FimT family pseudopilin [Ramlibacter sp.]